MPPESSAAATRYACCLPEWVTMMPSRRFGLRGMPLQGHVEITKRLAQSVDRVRGNAPLSEHAGSGVTKLAISPRIRHLVQGGRKRMDIAGWHEQAIRPVPHQLDGGPANLGSDNRQPR